MSPKLECALALAAQGFYLFPITSNKRRTPLYSWPEISTRRPETIKDWLICPYMQWEQDYNPAIDTGKSGVLVMDVDCKRGKKGLESYEAWQKEYGFPRTFTVRTPSGGLHLYYRSSGFRNTTERLAPGIDTRAEGGFVVAPGATIDGVTYEIIDDAPVADLPDWLKDKLHALKAEAFAPSERGRVVIEDDPDDIQSAIAFLQEHEPAVEGAGGDNHTFITFCMLKERGISEALAVQLADEYWNPECSPPWEYSDLQKKAHSAYKSAQNATGSKSPHAEFDVASTPDTPLPPALFKPGWEPKESHQIPPRDWVLPPIALRGKLSVGIAPPGAGKSTLSLALALSKITGRNLLGFDPGARGAVAVINNEDDMEEMERRLVAQMQAYRIPRAELYPMDVSEGGSMLFLNSGEDRRFRIAKRLNDGKLKAADADALVQYIRENRIDLVIVDPFAETHPAQENSNEEILQVAAMYRAVAQLANCAVILIHHTRKPDKASNEGYSGNMDSARGASSLIGVARVVFTLNTLSASDAKRYGVADRQRHRYLVVELAKANMSAPGENRWFFERVGERIGVTEENLDGESVGILRPVTFKDREADEMPAPVRTLLDDIETLVEDAPMGLSDIARELVSSFAFHQGKQPRSLEKSIQRLFPRDGVLQGLRGVLYLERVKDAATGRERYAIRLNATTPELYAML